MQSPLNLHFLEKSQLVSGLTNLSNVLLSILLNLDIIHFLNNSHDYVSCLRQKQLFLAYQCFRFSSKQNVNYSGYCVINHFNPAQQFHLISFKKL